MVGLLTKHGVRAKLIQSMDGFRLYDLAEIRFFLKAIDRRQGPAPTISDSAWAGARDELRAAYRGSACLESCLNLMDEFEQAKDYGRYCGDLEEYIRCSQYEDFYSDDRETVFVSTIHKAKGREFDSVYLLLAHVPVENDADRRKLYVGMTRAKENLYIHCNTDIFDACQFPAVETLADPTAYPPPAELTLQLTLRDVVLDFFKGKKARILRLRSGDPLGRPSGRRSFPRPAPPGSGSCGGGDTGQTWPASDLLPPGRGSRTSAKPPSCWRPFFQPSCVFTPPDRDPCPESAGTPKSS